VPQSFENVLPPFSSQHDAAPFCVIVRFYTLTLHVFACIIVIVHNIARLGKCQIGFRACFGKGCGAMNVTSAEIEQLLIRLAETPRRLAVLTNGRVPVQLHAAPDQDTWSIQAILAHLRSCADVWGKSILSMIAEDNPTLRYVSPRTWMRKTDYLEQAFGSSFEAFAKQRADLLTALNGLTDADWARMATFTGTVKGRNQTIFSYAQRIVDHERQHLDQVESILNRIDAVAKE
jgi:hypothetical protein